MPPRVPARTRMRRRWQDAAFVIPVFAALLLMPPFLNLFTIRRVIFGVPLEVVYLFAIWSALVIGAVVLSRHLPHQIDPTDEADSAEQDDF